ncbi:MAG: hypothetical protein JWM50_2269 [Microbacteriaceae bacterium]|nr:hypothetical protein [Microbacteriaceae bacterium]
MTPDLDDTRAPAPRPDSRPSGRGDLDDTISRARSLAPDLDDTILRAAPGGPPQPRPPVAPPAAAPPPAAVSPRYGFRIGASGRAVRLDVAAYVGRGPKAPRIRMGESPRLIRVASPRGEVSNTHLEIRQLGASVVITDLRSTNGSTVAVPGSAPHTLRQGESMVVTPGTLVDIGDGNVIEILPLHRPGRGDA